MLDHSWLAYSPKCDGGFSLPCVLFPCGVDQRQLTANPMKNLKKATTLLEKYSKQQGHLDAVAKLAQFQSTYIAGNVDVADQLASAHCIQIKENEEKLKGILDTIVFCGKQIISLCGHRNEHIIVSHDGQGAERNVFLIQKEDGNPGNFLTLLEFRAKSGGASIIRDFHLHQDGSGLLRVNFCSPTSQNELISCCAEYIREKILKKTRNAPFFSVMADEATDPTNMEQRLLVLRFVHDFEVREEFLGFVNCETGVSGEALAEIILDAVRSWNLNLLKRRGQGYDEAANMAGSLNGRAGAVQRELSKAQYCDCNAHALNLCVIGISRISLVSNM